MTLRWKALITELPLPVGCNYCEFLLCVCVCLGGLGVGERLRTRQIPNCTNVWNEV